jgi:hypothetical protein
VSPGRPIPRRLGVDPLEHPLEVGAGERPLERVGDLAVAAAEGEQALCELLQGAEVVRVSALRWTIEK